MDDSSTRRGSRKLSEAEQRHQDILEYQEQIYYSPRYYDDVYEYRHVNVPKQIARWIPQGRLMDEQEWRGLGVKQSPGWIHYMIHNPEPHILLFRREKDYQTKYPNGHLALPSKVGGLVG